MRWNPFAKETPPPDDRAKPPPVESTRQETTPRNDAVVAEIRAARAQNPLSDTRPLHRAILGGNFLLPVHAPAEPRPGGQTAMRPIEFYRDDAPSLVAFTDLETLRAAMDAEGHSDCAWAPIYGPPLVRMAVQGEFARLVLNIDAEDTYVLRPLVFGTLADGFVPAALASDAEHVGEPLRLVASGDGPNPARRPPDGLGDDLRDALGLAPDARVIWFESGWPPDELRFNVAVDLDPDEAASRYGAAQLAWIRRWPVPTPLGLHGREILNADALGIFGVPL